MKSWQICIITFLCFVSFFIGNAIGNKHQRAIGGQTLIVETPISKEGFREMQLNFAYIKGQNETLRSLLEVQVMKLNELQNTCTLQHRNSFIHDLML